MNSILNPALIILNKKQKKSKEIIYEIILGANKLIKLSFKTQESKIFELLLSQPSFDEQSNLLQKFPNLKGKLSEKNLIFSNIPKLLNVTLEMINLKNCLRPHLKVRQETKKFLLLV